MAILVLQSKGGHSKHWFDFLFAYFPFSQLLKKKTMNTFIFKSFHTLQHFFLTLPKTPAQHHVYVCVCVYVTKRLKRVSVTKRFPLKTKWKVHQNKDTNHWLLSMNFLFLTHATLWLAHTAMIHINFSSLFISHSLNKMKICLCPVTFQCVFRASVTQYMCYKFHWAILTSIPSL